MVKKLHIMAQWARDKFGIDLTRIVDALHDDTTTSTFTKEHSEQVAAALIVTSLNEVQVLPYHMPVMVDPKSGLMLVEPPDEEAFCIRSEKRWWICHWTPSRQIVRILTSYPDKATAVRAVSIMGYKYVQPPLGMPEDRYAEPRAEAS